MVYNSAKEADLHQLKQQDQVTITDGVQTGDTVTVSVNSNSSSYTVKDGDSVNTIRDALLALLTSNPVINTVANVTAGATGEMLLEALKYGTQGYNLETFGDTPGSITQKDYKMAATLTPLLFPLITW